MTSNEHQNGASQYIKTFIDLGGLVGFAAVYFITKDFLLATWILVGVSIVAVVLGLVLDKKIAYGPLVTAVLAIIFGGLTLVFKDPRILKMKLTIIYGVFTLILLGGFYFKKMPLKLILGQALPLKEEAWKTISLAYAGFFATVALANEIIWRTQSEEFWVMFKTALFFVFIAFSVALAPYMMKNMIPEETPEKDQEKASDETEDKTVAIKSEAEK